MPHMQSLRVDGGDDDDSTGSRTGDASGSSSGRSTPRPLLLPSQPFSAYDEKMRRENEENGK
jgi:hypothetical protein